MTSIVQAPPKFEARGWVLWLTWLYVALFGLGTLFGVAILILGQNAFGLEMRGPDQVTLWWVLLQVPYIVFAIGCAGVLLKDRDFAWATVVSAWVITVVQIVQAFLQLAHLRISIPFSAFVFAAYAIGMTKLLRPSPISEGRAGRGTM